MSIPLICCAVSFIILAFILAHKNDQLRGELKHQKEFTNAVYKEKVLFEGKLRDTKFKLDLVTLEHEQKEKDIESHRLAYKKMASAYDAVVEKNKDLNRQLTDIFR